MSPRKDGMNPIAKFTERAGDLLATLDYLADRMDTDEYAFVAVVHGDVYLVEYTDEEDATWKIGGDVDGCEDTSDWDAKLDRFASKFPGDTFLADELGGPSTRMFVYEPEE